jgi:hypothetical protein
LEDGGWRGEVERREGGKNNEEKLEEKELVFYFPPPSLIAPHPPKNVFVRTHP